MTTTKNVSKNLLQTHRKIPESKICHDISTITTVQVQGIDSGKFDRINDDVIIIDDVKNNIDSQNRNTKNSDNNINTDFNNDTRNKKRHCCCCFNNNNNNNFYFYSYCRLKMKKKRKLYFPTAIGTSLHIFVFLVTLSMMQSIINANRIVSVWETQLMPSGAGRNIRHLPCVSRRTGETGLCMFAYSCAKANGTHLGTCIDRFYFGSCCKINDYTATSTTINVNFTSSTSAIRSTTVQPSLVTWTTIENVPFIPSDRTKPPLRLTTTGSKPTGKPSTTFVTKPLKPTNKPTKPTPPSFPTKLPSTPPTFPTKLPSSPPSFPTKLPSSSRPSTNTGKPPGAESSFVTKPFNSTRPSSFPSTISTLFVDSRPITKPLRPTTSTPLVTRPSPPIITRPSSFSSSSIMTSSNYDSYISSIKPISESKPTTVASNTPSPWVEISVTTHAPTIPSSSSTTGIKHPESSTLISSSSGHTTTINKKPITSSSTSTTIPAGSTKYPAVTSTAQSLPAIETNEIVESNNNFSTTQQQQLTWTTIGSSGGHTSTNSTSTATTTTEKLLLVSSSTTIGQQTTQQLISTTGHLPTTKPVTNSGSSTMTIPVSSPLPVETTPSTVQSIEINEVDTSGINMSNYKDVCGRRLYPTARIVGGAKATFGKWPWQVSLRQWRTSTYLHKCGAALFNENWAVTAAHCVENVPPIDLLLRLGEHDLSVEDEPHGYQERRVQIVASHPQFDPRTFEYDLALLRFYEPVKFQPNIIPICVPEDDTNFVEATAYVTGWGRLYEDGPLPSMLQEVSVPVINNSICESMYKSAGYIEHIPQIFICAGYRKGGYDSCEGDSGGPMVIQRPDGRWLLAGIISWGIGCAEPNQPGVYTRISEFRDWINKILEF